MLVSPNPAPIAGEDATICTGDEVTLGSVSLQQVHSHGVLQPICLVVLAEPVFSTNSAGTYRMI
ncbi:MAG: hypothetical protein R3A43_07390 [Bacteroidia bacterium]